MTATKTPRSSPPTPETTIDPANAWVDDLVMTLPGTTMTLQPTWNAETYHVAGKAMGMRGAFKDGRAIVTLKLPPEHSVHLREAHVWAVPGYYSNKTHYTSVFLDEAPREAVAELVELSWETVVAGMSKKAQRELRGQD